MWQALLFNFSAIICHLSPHLSSSFRLDGGRHTFSGFSRHIWLGSSPGCGWATQRHSQRCISHSCCVPRVTVLLVGKHSAQSEVLNTLDWVFIKGISIFWCIELFFYSDESLSPCCWKTTPQYEAATTTLYFWDGTLHVMSRAGYGASSKKCPVCFKCIQLRVTETTCFCYPSMKQNFFSELFPRCVAWCKPVSELYRLFF